MPVSLEQYRESLGKRAEGLSDEEVQRMLDYTCRFAEAYYDWWNERKDTGREAITGRYVFDMILEAERRQEKGRSPIMKRNKDGTVDVEHVITLDTAWLAAIREHIWKIPKGNLLQS